MSKTMSTEVCHVGFTASADDRLRVNKVMSFLDEIGYSTAHWRILQQDTMDLNHGNFGGGRDFLMESDRYRVVILHFLWRPDNFRARNRAPLCPQMTTSPLHSWAAWRYRLVQTEADYIFPFGSTTEISGSFIAPLSGYNLYGPADFTGLPIRSRNFDEDEDFWVFCKADKPQAKEGVLKLYGKPIQTLGTKI